jgi:hypothetical protein
MHAPKACVGLFCFKAERAGGSFVVVVVTALAAREPQVASHAEPESSIILPETDATAATYTPWGRPAGIATPSLF